MTCLESNGLIHVWGVVNGIAYHWWQPLGGPGWQVEKLPAPA